ncbi:hypothetical protein TELCIR_02618 [Teladorsagia circumcincta]|uniref:Uncharacterized protein n=1 Tax=Teladorsagia circumcincta TaxID=45464 RepID=A0A2G9V0Q5_TELCI|nr:hypothetical protein TELCIR_02618 [Teladorsagia circumcincta]
MKECISEQDHYQLFPNKGYAMEEECDLVEVHGQEKNPELFAEPEQPTPTIPKGPAPLAPPVPMQAPNGFGAPPIPPPPIIPVNDPRNRVPGIESEIRRAQLPTRERSDDGAVPFSVGQGKFIGSMGIKHHAVAVAAPPSAPPRAPSQAPRMEQSPSDCERQVVVNCHDPDSVCFTRQIILNAGQTAVEKMCASWQAVKQEFPTSALDSCAEASEGRRAKDFPTDPLPPFVRTHPSGPLPHLAAPELPVVKAAPVPPAPTARQPELPPQVIAAVPSIHPIPKEQQTNSFPSPQSQQNRDQDQIDLAPVPIEAVVHQGTNKVEQPIERGTLRCSACLETGITEPTADCASSAPASCAAHENYCLTRQTQNEGATFTMEKRCVSAAVVASLIKSEPAEVRPGCAIADAGMTNYCLCKEDLCNHDSLLAQAQISGVRKSEPAPKVKTPALEEVQENIVAKQPSPEVTHVFLDSDETPSVETSQVPEQRLSDEERDLIERQKQWDQADLAASASRLGLLSAALIGAFFL